MTNRPSPDNRVSPHTSVSLLLGTGEECGIKNPPNLSHLSNEHLEGLYNAANEERNNRISEMNTGEGSLLDIGLEQGTTNNETNYIDQCG